MLKYKVEVVFPKLAFIADTKVRCKQKSKAKFLTECRRAPAQVQWLYQSAEIVVGSTLDAQVERLDWFLEEVHFLNNSEFSLTWRLAQNVLPLFDLAFKADLVDLRYCFRCNRGMEEIAVQTFYSMS